VTPLASEGTVGVCQGCRLLPAFACARGLHGEYVRLSARVAAGVSLPMNVPACLCSHVSVFFCFRVRQFVCGCMFYC